VTRCLQPTPSSSLASEDHTVKIWDLSDDEGREINTFIGHGGSVHTAPSSATQSWATGGWDQTIRSGTSIRQSGRQTRGATWRCWSILSPRMGIGWYRPTMMVHHDLGHRVGNESIAAASGGTIYGVVISRDERPSRSEAATARCGNGGTGLRLQIGRPTVIARWRSFPAAWPLPAPVSLSFGASTRLRSRLTQLGGSRDKYEVTVLIKESSHAVEGPTFFPDAEPPAFSDHKRPLALARAALATLAGRILQSLRIGSCEIIPDLHDVLIDLLFSP
jgi:hypothetical protein